MTFSTIPCRIEKRAGTQPLRTRSSGDRAFGSGPKGRRFESCRVQQRSLDFSGLLFLCDSLSYRICPKQLRIGQTERREETIKRTPFAGRKRSANGVLFLSD